MCNNKIVLKRLGYKIIEHNNSAVFIVVTERYYRVQL